MRQLLLLRHAKSSWDDPALDDHDRPLNPRGHHTAALLRGAMRAIGLLPDVVLVSTARRTRETLAALEPWDETPLVEELRSLYLATTPQLLAALNAVPETARSVLLVGHNPGLHDLALLLAGSQDALATQEATRRLAEGFPTGGLAEFAVTGRWSILGAGGARLDRFIDPHTLTEPLDLDAPKPVGTSVRD